MNGKKLRLGLVGKDVSKSDSGRIHTFLLTELGYEVEYENISTNSDGFDSVVRYLMGDFDGFNVTIPYKRDIMEYLDEIVGDAQAFGAVNTVVPAVTVAVVMNTATCNYMHLGTFADKEIVINRIIYT